MKTILDAIGHTPLIRATGLSKEAKANILVKPEYMNPSGSIKDRIALRMINDAEQKGWLKPGYTILESSTGNTGIALSFVGSLKGYRVVIYETTPGKIGEEKRKIMRGYGADVRSLPPEDLARMKEKSVAGAEVEKPGRQMCLNLERENRDHWWARQFSNPANVQAQKEMGLEILEQTGGKVDVFIASIGTGGTLAGVAEALKKENPRVRVVGVQPASSQKKIVPGQPYPQSEIDGGIIAEMVKVPKLIDEVVMVGDSEAVGMTHRLRRDGFFAGVSSGANILVALREAKKQEGADIVTILCDSADRYFTEEHYVT
ncbi:MAG TPA: cysteine synthase family protein [Thermodesulfobacteriota bacterium]|nr:cysteine synthase family protein [Thermodesulfobacteriota bacterium]